MHDEARHMGTEPEARLIARFALPAMAGLLSNALYNIVDRVFIGHWVGSLGLAALTVAFPIAVFQGALSSLMSVGGSSLMARQMGAGNTEGGRQTLGNTMVLGGVFTALLCLGIELFLEPAARLCGATPDIFDLSTVYLRIVLVGMAFQILAIIQNCLIRALGRPRRAMESVIIGTMSNVVLDWLFIVIFKWGVAGAAWATVIGQFLSLLWVTVDLWGPRAPLRPALRHWKLRWTTVAEVASIGFSPFLGNLFFSVLMVLFNLILSEQGGSLALSAMGIFFSLDSLLFLPVMGLGDGVMPLVGFNYGAGHLNRVRRLVSVSLWISVAFLGTSTFVTEFWAEHMVGLFVTDDPTLTVAAARAMRIGYVAMPLAAVAMTTAFVLQGLGRARESILLMLGRQIIILVPVLTLPHRWGIDGLWASFPIVDLLGGAVGGWLLWREWRRWNEAPGPRKEIGS